MEPKSIKNRFKIQAPFQSDFEVVLEPFLVNFGSVLRSLGPQKWSSPVGEVLFSRKSRFSGQMRFWLDFCLHCCGTLDCFSDRKTHSKIKQNIDHILNDFLMECGVQFGSKWRPCWLQFRLRKIIEILQDFRRPQGPRPRGTPPPTAYPHISKYMLLCLKGPLIISSP